MMDLLKGINYVDLLLAAVFLIPVAAGAISRFSKERISYSLDSWLSNLSMAAGILLSVYFTRRIFLVRDGSIFNTIYELLPLWVKNALYQKELLAYVTAGPVILILLLLGLRILFIPVRRYVLLPISDGLYRTVRTMGSGMQRLMGAVWQVPKALCFTLAAALVLNFSTFYLYAPLLSEWMNRSTLYRTVYDTVLYPALNSNLAKQIPVLLNDSFRQTADSAVPRQAQAAVKKLEEATGGRIRIIEYFNGVTLDEAVKSNEAIDAKAREIVGKEEDEKQKAYLLYKWISKNIQNDTDKAEKISKSSRGIQSGSIVAFETRKGICFDYSSLYVSMCRAVGLKVRLLTGLGYNGTSWGDHAWNQVYNASGDQWINVDATFGVSGINYYDKKNFGADHTDAEIQGEWPRE